MSFVKLTGYISYKNGGRNIPSLDLFMVLTSGKPKENQFSFIIKTKGMSFLCRVCNRVEWPVDFHSIQGIMSALDIDTKS